MARQMKDSGIEWIGEIPESWELQKGKYLYRQRSEKGNSIELQLLSPTQKYGVIPQSLYEKISGMKPVQLDAKADLEQFKSIYAGDFCISLRSFQGGFEYSQYNGVVSPAYQVFYRQSDTTYDAFYRYIFKEMGFIGYMNSFTKSFRDGKSIAFDDFAGTLLPVPPIAEQHRIAAFLDRKCAEIDAVIERTKATIEEYKKLKQAVITEAVTKGVRSPRPMKDSGIEWLGCIPDEWDCTKLKQVWISVDSGVSVNAADYPTENDTQYGVLKTSCVSKFVFLPHEHKQVDADEYDRVACSVKKDTIIVSRMNTPDLVGACGYVDADYPNLFLPDRLWQIGFHPEVIAKFVWYYLNNQMVRAYISSLSTGTSSSMQNISKPQFGGISLAVPAIEEQHEIVAYLDEKCAALDTLIAKKTDLLTELETYKKSLIHEYVTGKKEVL